MDKEATHLDSDDRIAAMDRFHQQLLNPSTYPETTQSVGFKETHISRVYLTDQYAYKLKKPLDLGFLDFSTLEKRHHFCNEEVRLNRRFTKNVYLGVAELRQQQSKICFSSRGQLLDYAVQMRRLPEELMLDRLIEIGLIQQSDAMAMRMMLSMFTIPGEGNDILKMLLEVTEEGRVLSNGQRIR